jgi:hypothetical protein
MDSQECGEYEYPDYEPEMFDEPGSLSFCQCCGWWQSTALMPDGECICPVGAICPAVGRGDANEQ